MKSSLIPENPILVYPSLAATIGLDETVMLSVLSECVKHLQGTQRNGFAWYEISFHYLSHQLTFWNMIDIQRVITSMREKGILLVGSLSNTPEGQLKFAFNEKVSGHIQQQIHQQETVEAQPLNQQFRPEAGKNYIAENWTPDETTLGQLAQLAIPRPFALEQLPEFITYWRERREAHRSWGQKFINHTVKRWRTFEAQENRQNRATPMTADWTPSDPCLEELEQRNIPRDFVLDQIQEFIRYWQATEERHISWDNKFIQNICGAWARQENQRNVSLQKFAMHDQWRPSTDTMEHMVVKGGIPESFIEEAIPEFIIYWKDKGHETTTWNSLFIKHIRLQWHRYKHSCSHTMEPQPIAQDWQPDEDVYDILRMANIDQQFARALIPEFVLYWRDSNQIHTSWNTRYIRHVKKTWAQRHSNHYATHGHSDAQATSTRDMSLHELLTDRSWAE